MDDIKPVYSDLKVSVSSKRVKELLETAERCYGRVALDQEVEFSGKKTTLPAVDGLKKLIGSSSTSMEVLTRLTVFVDSPSLLHAAMNSPVLEGYDITALKAGNEKVFQAAATSASTDIITLECGERLGFPVKRSQLAQFIARGMVFELVYVPSIKDSSVRRNTLANGMEIVTATKGKGILVSSAAEKGLDLRGPLDIINLCQLFGLKPEQCKAAVTTSAQQVLVHSRMRKFTAKGIVSCEYTPTLKEGGPSKRTHSEDNASDDELSKNKKQKNIEETEIKQ